MKTILLFACLCAVPALAQGKKFEASCGADVAKFCPGTTDKKSVHACIKTHSSELSQPCAEFLASRPHKGAPPPAPPPAQ